MGNFKKTCNENKKIDPIISGSNNGSKDIMKESIKEFERFEEGMKYVISTVFGELIKNINDCLQEVVKLTVDNAENFEHLFAVQLDILKNQRMENDYHIGNSKNMRVKLTKEDFSLKTKELVSSNGCTRRLQLINEKSSLKSDQCANGTGYTKTEIDSYDEETSQGWLLQDNLSEKPGKLKSLVSLQNHPLERHFECNQCVYKTNDQSNLTRHVKSKHSLVKDWGCTECEFVASRKDALHAHLKNKHRVV